MSQAKPLPMRSRRSWRAIVKDPLASARLAGLHHVSDVEPGITRRRARGGFAYTHPDGRPVRERQELARIRSLALPPAWTEVWIAPDPLGHMQATGRDAKGRKQYRYHPLWRAVRDETKYNRMIAFAEALPRIRAGVDRDLRRPGLARERVLAAVVDLLDETYIRVGNEAYARENKSFGLTTLRNRHVTISGATLTFTFRGKSGKVHEIALRDGRLARIVQRLRDLPGQELFQYVDEAGERHSAGSADVNAYLREAAGDDFSAKDFRTWAGTVAATSALEELGPAQSAAEAKRNIVEAIKVAAAKLGNTPAICRSCYVHPGVLDAYEDGTLLADDHRLPPGAEAANGLRPEEARVLALLRRLEARTAREHAEQDVRAS
jgi:DNA topoisomerase I